MDTLVALRRRFVSRLAGRVFVRFHMGLIFAGTVAAGVATSRLLYLAGVDALMVRYALAVAGSYLTFFLLVRAWIFYVARGGPSDLGVDLPDVWPAGGAGAPVPTFEAGGGHFGGGGASGTFDEPPVFRSLTEAGGGSGGGGGSSGGGDGWSLDLDDGLLFVIVLLVFVLTLGGVAVWLMWQAPVILPEAAFEALLVSGWLKAARRSEARGWARGVLRSTVIPFLLVLVAAAFVGWAVHHACPSARRLADVLGACE